MNTKTSQADPDFQRQRNSVFARLRNYLLGDLGPGTLSGGRTQALRQLYAFDPTPYGQTRNFIDSPVSRLSPFLRHGMISPVEVRDHLKGRFPSDPARLDEFLRQLAWRDFFEKVRQSSSGFFLNTDI